MEAFAKAIGMSALFCALILMWAPFTTALGWLAGWTVSLFFNDMIIGVLAKCGLHDVSLPELGAALGFLSAFLRTSTTVKK